MVEQQPIDPLSKEYKDLSAQNRAHDIHGEGQAVEQTAEFGAVHGVNTDIQHNKGEGHDISLQASNTNSDKEV